MGAPCAVQVSSTAVSTTDYMALYLLMLDVRVKLLEDTAEVHKVSSRLALETLSWTHGTWRQTCRGAVC